MEVKQVVFTVSSSDPFVWHVVCGFSTFDDAYRYVMHNGYGEPSEMLVDGNPSKYITSLDKVNEEGNVTFEYNEQDIYQITKVNIF